MRKGIGVSIDSSINLGGSIGPAIPPDFNKLSRYEAAQYYVEKLGWAILPLYGPNQGRGKERGKRLPSRISSNTRLRKPRLSFLPSTLAAKKAAMSAA
jgi:hypothetical protein